MTKQIVAIWFPHLLTDRMLRQKAELKGVAFALAANERGKRMTMAVNAIAQQKGVYKNMAVADCKAIVPELQVFDYDGEQQQKLIAAMAEWCISFTPYVCLDSNEGLILDATGCTHLWGGQEAYLKTIMSCFKNLGYSIRIAMAETKGTAWALCRFGKTGTVCSMHQQKNSLSGLPPAALRLEETALQRLDKLGLKTIGSFMDMPKTALRRRFGQQLLNRLAQALGEEMELLEPIRPIAPYTEQLPCIDHIRTAPGIEKALLIVLEALCKRLANENKGLRKCELRCYRIDGDIQKIEIGTSSPTRNVNHIFKLFELKINTLEPDLGFELFMLEAPIVEDLFGNQDTLWHSGGSTEKDLAELLDKIAGKIGSHAIHRYLPAEHYWPERSMKTATSLTEKSDITWRVDLPRPIHLLPNPEPIEVTVPIPDYPPLMFIYKNIRHHIQKADGPERIEQEWWLQSGLYRDYYCVEDEKGCRYWLFRSGDYGLDDVKWFLHGFFA